MGSPRRPLSLTSYAFRFRRHRWWALVPAGAEATVADVAGSEVVVDQVRRSRVMGMGAGQARRVDATGSLGECEVFEVVHSATLSGYRYASWPLTGRFATADHREIRTRPNPWP